MKKCLIVLFSMAASMSSSFAYNADGDIQLVTIGGVKYDGCNKGGYCADGESCLTVSSGPSSFTKVCADDWGYITLQ
jgi:hypothetical protein